MKERSGGVRASMVTTLPRPNRVYSTDRVCLDEGCDTRLSRYNKRDYCFAHAPVVYPVMRGRKPKDETRAA